MRTESNGTKAEKQVMCWTNYDFKTEDGHSISLQKLHIITLTWLRSRFTMSRMATAYTPLPYLQCVWLINQVSTTTASKRNNRNQPPRHNSNLNAAALSGSAVPAANESRR